MLRGVGLEAVDARDVGRGRGEVRELDALARADVDDEAGGRGEEGGRGAVDGGLGGAGGACGSTVRG